MRIERGIVVWEGLLALPQALAVVFAFEWVLRVRRTIPASNLNTQGPDRLLRIAQGLALLYGVLCMAFPALHANHFGNLVLYPGERVHWSFWMFFAPLALSILVGTAGSLFTLYRRPDRAEIRRLVAFAIGAPIMAAGIVLPPNVASLSTTVGLLVLLVGSVQYHVTQGQRAQFLSRFLSPQVAQLVTRRGLKSATDEKTVELSVVYCDLRGFTAFSAATSSRRVIEILRERLAIDLGHPQLLSELLPSFDGHGGLVDLLYRALIDARRRGLPACGVAASRCSVLTTRPVERLPTATGLESSSKVTTTPAI